MIERENALDGDVRWYQHIREIHDGHFLDPWQERADAINQRYDLPPQHRLLTHGPGIPLPWFLGDVEGIEPGCWVLTISLNHQFNPDAPFFRKRLGDPHPTADTYWDYCRRFNRDHFYRRFFGPLARVAASGLGQQVPKNQECDFAAKQMIFSEICPYGSSKFSLGWPEIEELIAADQGFQLAREVNQLLIEAGQPAFVMVNGNAAVNMFQQLYADALSWQEVRYDSCDMPRDGRMRKRLRHWCGVLRVDHGTVPIVGFPFLRTPGTHNSDAEVGQLGSFVRLC